MTDDLGARAERFMTAVYHGDSAVVEEMAAEGIVSTYPIFETLFGSPAIEGRAAYLQFATGFASRWADPLITFHRTIASDRTVVSMWSFSARWEGPAEIFQPGESRSWGGITILEFDEAGRVVSEIGEESTPGPMGRLDFPGD